MSLKEKSCINDQKKQNELNYKKDELDYVFEKLMVSPIQNHKRLQNEIRLHGEISRSLKKKKEKKKEKRLLHRPKLVLSELYDDNESSKLKEHHSDDLNIDKIFLFSEQIEDSKKKLNNNNWSCSTQFLKNSFLQSQSVEDSNPEELASYFEQLLYIPKPMSYMAEMMYA